MKKSFIRNIRLISVLMCILLSFTACYSHRMIDYYSQPENYVRATGTVSFINYNDDETTLCIAFSDLDLKLDDNTFEIVGDNLKILKEKGIDEKLQLGKRIEFVTAPRYFGDGYVMPIVGLTIDGEVLLEPEIGVENFLDSLYNGYG